jgi:hypothetical protein
MGMSVADQEMSVVKWEMSVARGERSGVAKRVLSVTE